MDLLKYVTETEKEVIGRYIDDYAEVPLNVSVDKILQPWAKNKETLFPLFADTLILEKDVTYVKGEDELLEDIYHQLIDNPKDEVVYNFVNSWKEAFCYRFRWYTRERDEEAEAQEEMRSNLYHFLDDDNLLSGRWERDTCEIKLDDMEKPIKIQHGAHIMKFIRKFAEIYHIEGFEQFRIKHSQIMNQKKLIGKLCLSIHPLDFMTMSDNNCDWSSCMSWKEEGCYRQGTVEMMNSPCVIVAYLRAKDDMRLYNISWSNKKWRELFIITPTGIMNIKSYPYHNPEITKVALAWIKEIAEKADFGNYMDMPVEYDPYYNFKVDGIDYDCNISPSTHYMYNDFGSGHANFVYFTTDRELYNGGTYNFNYSGPSECMSCGDTGERFASEQNLSCDYCYAPKTCCNCDCILDDGDGWYVDGELFCDDCLEEQTYVDPITDERHILDTDEVVIYAASNNGQSFYPDFSITIEESTLKDKFEDYCLVKPHRLHKNNEYSNKYYLRRDELTEKGLELFFSQEYWDWRERVLKVPSDEEMLEDCFIRDIPDAA